MLTRLWHFGHDVRAHVMLLKLCETYMSCICAFGHLTCKFERHPRQHRPEVSSKHSSVM